MVTGHVMQNNSVETTPAAESRRAYVPQVFSVEEAARRISISSKQLRQLIADGRGPAVTRLSDGGRMLIREDALRYWLDLCTDGRPE
jgi:excisionase family DNA binding protein